MAPSPVNSDVTNFEDVDQEVEEDDTDGGSTAGNSFVSGAPQNLNDIQRAQIISPLRNSLRGITTPLKVGGQNPFARVTYPADEACSSTLSP